MDLNVEVPLERGKVREFAVATGSTNTAYYADDAVVPPTFLVSARNYWGPTMTEVLDALGVDLRRVLHAEEEFVFPDGPPRAGRSVHMTSRLGDQYEKRGRRGGIMRFFTIIVDYRDDDGTLVAEQRTTLVETAAAPSVDDAGLA